MAAGETPVSTYRLQLTPEFGFADVAGIAGYLADLGVTHAYLSPILQAVPGSAHGYDVTDHSRIRAELGGEAGFRAMAAELRRHGIGIVLDIVPNHMAIPAPEHLNRQLWSVLGQGRGSPYAHWFDIDWSMHEGRILLPILAGSPEDCMYDLVVDRDGPEGAPVLRYFEHVLPLWPGTARQPMAGVLESQHYRLADWREASRTLNWRRFFDVTSLIAVRVEDRDVFDATHEVTLRLAAEGLIDGLRVDHPDGLADPRGYFRDLAAALAERTGTKGTWVVGEKILAWGERLPDDWPVAGTTGYDALVLADGVFTDPDAGGPLTEQYARFTARVAGRSAASSKAGSGEPGSSKPGAEAAGQDFATVAAQAKRETTATFGSEITRLARLLDRPSASEADEKARRQVLAELIAAFEVYRAYAYPGEVPSEQAEAAIRAALAAALKRLPPALHPEAARISAMVASATAPELATRFQQTTGPVLAKGIEDTAFYRWPRLLARNEVGGDPDRLGVTPEEFHEELGRLQREWPASMTTLSTHDTKRQEDVRARLAVLAEIPQEWGALVTDWHCRAGSGGTPATDSAAVDPDTEYLIWQTIVGAWPISGYRLSGYLAKAVREAKRHTSWTDPDDRYESSVHGLAARILGNGALSAEITAFVARISGDALANSLGVKLVQLTMPGVADTYQGCELAGLSLVDPDNRRPVDYTRRRALLAQLDKGHNDVDELDAAKLLVTSRALRLRRAHPEWFTGPDAACQPLRAEGSAAGHAIAFQRTSRAAPRPGAITVATRLPAGLRTRGGWADTALPLPGQPAAWRDLLTGRIHPGASVQMSELTRQLPVALLVAYDSVADDSLGQLEGHE